MLLVDSVGGGFPVGVRSAHLPDYGCYTRLLLFVVVTFKRLRCYVLLIADVALIDWMFRYIGYVGTTFTVVGHYTRFNLRLIYGSIPGLRTLLFICRGRLRLLYLIPLFDCVGLPHGGPGILVAPRWLILIVGYNGGCCDLRAVGSRPHVTLLIYVYTLHR